MTSSTEATVRDAALDVVTDGVGHDGSSSRSGYGGSDAPLWRYDWTHGTRYTSLSSRS